jgi:hypothetical protein
MEGLRDERELLPPHLQKDLDHIAWYEKRIQKQRKENREDYATLIDLMSEMLIFIGNITSYCETMVKVKKLEREQLYWETYQAAAKQKEMTASLAVLPLKREELEWFRLANDWSTTQTTIRDNMNALKYQFKKAELDGSVSNYHWEAHRKTK